MSIDGDSPMYSMIRRSGQPEVCPFHGPHTFSYAKGGAGAPCGYPQSYLDSCTNRTRLQLSFQACTDVAGSESSSEQLTCLAGEMVGYAENREKIWLICSFKFLSNYLFHFVKD